MRIRPFFIALAISSSTQAQSDSESSLWNREQLADDIFGLRGHLESRGMDLRLEATNFYQGDVHGPGPQDMEFGGKTDLFFAMDGQKAGLWPGLFLNVHGEHRYGEASAQAGALTPVNASLLVPAEEGNAFAFTNVVLTQAFSESLLLSVGKFNTVDLADRNFLGGGGNEGFWNISLVAPPIAGRTIPVSTLGAIMSVLDEGKPVFNIGVVDAVSPMTSPGFDGLGSDEMTFLADYTFYTDFGGLEGTHTLAGSFSTINALSLDANDYLRPPTAGAIIPGRQNDSWYVSYTFEQFLWQNPDDAEKGWGLFGMLAWSDGNPNTFETSAVLGLAANGINEIRPNDHFGIGMFWNEVSNSLTNSVSPRVTLQDEYGAEFFYDAEILPWFRIGADVQWVRPVIDSGANDSVYVGFRSRVMF